MAMKMSISQKRPLILHRVQPTTFSYNSSCLPFNLEWHLDCSQVDRNEETMLFGILHFTTVLMQLTKSSYNQCITELVTGVETLCRVNFAHSILFVDTINWPRVVVECHLLPYQSSKWFNRINYLLSTTNSMFIKGSFTVQNLHLH